MISKGGGVAPMLDEVNCIEGNAQASQNLAHLVTS